MRSSHGFTLAEIVISLGIILLFVGLSAVASTQTIRNVEFDRVRNAVRIALASAQMDSIGGTLDSSWGVAFFPNAIIRYRGENFATRTTADDRTTIFRNEIVMSGSAEVAFTRPFGLPSSPAAVIMSDGLHTATATVTGAGAIEIQ